MPQIDPAELARHPIRVVSERTGLSPDVLRAWQKRYGAVVPGRSHSGQRLYSDADIERLRLIAEAVRAGRGVGQVAQLSSEQIVAVLREDKSSERTRADDTQATVALCRDLTAELDEEQLELQLRRALMAFGVDVFLEGVIVPLLAEIGEGWSRGELTPAHEHMASTVVRRVLEWVIRSAETGTDAPLLVLTTPSGELHELGALLAATVAALEGWRIRYLGPNLPAADLAHAVQQADARAVAVSAVHSRAQDIKTYFNALTKQLKGGATVFAGGSAVTGAKLSGVKVFESLQEFRTELAVLRVTGPA